MEPNLDCMNKMVNLNINEIKDMREYFEDLSDVRAREVKEDIKNFKKKIGVLRNVICKDPNDYTEIKKTIYFFVHNLKKATKYIKFLDKNKTPSNIIEHCKERLAEYKCPKVVLFLFVEPHFSLLIL